MVDFDYFLRQKYAQLQQQADATTQNAQTSSVVGRAAANLDNVRAALMPAESKANIGLTRANTGQAIANTGLITEQAKIVAPESAARIANMNADTALTRTNRDVAIRQNLTPLGEIFGGGLPSFQSLLTGGGAGGQTFRTSNITPAFAPRRGPVSASSRGSGPNGAMTAAELDRYNGF